MKFKSLQDTGSRTIEFCADRMMQACGLDENTQRELRDEGRACALIMEHVGQRMDGPPFWYETMVA